MKVNVKIECETISELHTHLIELAKQVKKSARKQKLNPLRDEFAPEDADSLCDDNCYGSHAVKIKVD